MFTARYAHSPYIIQIRFVFKRLNSVYALPADGTDVPKHVAVVKYRILMYVCNLCFALVLEMNIRVNSVNG